MRKIREIKNTILNIPNVQKLKKNGMIVGENFFIQRGCVIDTSHCWLIKIGNNVTLGPGVHILAHDASTKQAQKYTKIGLVEIGDNVFVGANSTILPNVKIGNNVVIGANSVVTKDIVENSVAVGSPCRVIDKYENFVEKNKNLMNKVSKFDKSYTVKGGIDNKKKKEMINSLKKHKIGFII